MAFKLGYYGEPFEYTPKRRTSGSGVENSVQFAANIRNQAVLFEGGEVKTLAGNPVPPTFEVNGDIVEYGLKFGGEFVKLDGHKTHYSWPKDSFVEYLKWLADCARDGEFELQLNDISARIGKKMAAGKEQAAFIKTLPAEMQERLKKLRPSLRRAEVEKIRGVEVSNA